MGFLQYFFAFFRKRKRKKEKGKRKREKGKGKKEKGKRKKEKGKRKSKKERRKRNLFEFQPCVISALMGVRQRSIQTELCKSL